MNGIGIGFDFDHTLGIDNGLERKAFYAFAEELGHPLDPNDVLWPERIEALLAELREGRTDLTSVIERFAQSLGVRGADPDRWRAICYGLVDRLVEPVDGACELLDTLRARGVPMAILTNGWTPLQQKKIARALGHHAPQTIRVSDQLGVLKPDRAAFDALVAVLGVPRDQTWYVGDNPRADIAGALAAGLRAVWFDWEGLSYPQDLPPPTLRIHALRELEPLSENTIAP